jgi:hypothetical protein
MTDTQPAAKFTCPDCGRWVPPPHWHAVPPVRSSLFAWVMRALRLDEIKRRVSR